MSTATPFLRTAASGAAMYCGRWPNGTARGDALLDGVAASGAVASNASVAAGNAVLSDVLATGLVSAIRNFALAADSVVVCDGNSLTYGSGLNYRVNDAYPAQLSNYGGYSGIRVLSSLGLTAQNVGIGGQTTLDMIASVGDVDSKFVPGKLNVLIAWEVRNDLYRIEHPSARTAVNNFWTYCDARRAVGWKVIVLSTLPSFSARAGEAGTQTDIDNFNALCLAADALMAAEYASHADAYTNLRAGNAFGAMTSYSQAAFESLGLMSNMDTGSLDLVHLNPSGYYVVAQKVAAVLLT